MDMKTELRWLVRPVEVYRLEGVSVVQESQRVLQYRTQMTVTDYGTPDHIRSVKWSDWQDVPEHKETL